MVLIKMAIHELFEPSRRICNQGTGYASQHIWCLSQARIIWDGSVRKGILRKNGGDGTISLDVVAVHPHCWCICLCYLHFAPENPEDGKMYLLVPAHPGCPRQSQRAVKWLCVCVLKYVMHSVPVLYFLILPLHTLITSLHTFNLSNSFQTVFPPHFL